MKCSVLITAITLFDASCALAQPRIRHTVVFKEEGRFAGWPANAGIWSWGDEIIVGFSLGYYRKNPTGGHDLDAEKPTVGRQARSLDGGETWTIEDDSTSSVSLTELTEPIDFSDPGLVMTFRGGRFCFSTDRAHTWHGACKLPTFGRPNLLCRTDYLVEGKHRLTAFIAAAKDSGGEGQPLCIRTVDGGITWEVAGWIGPQPPQDYGYAIMPATVRLGNTGYLSMIRRGGVFDGKKKWWLEAFMSHDDGKSWYLLDEPRIDNAGNPATLTRLKNGDLALAYGWRHAPYGIRARISTDDGQTWKEEIPLRSDGGSWDIGYPRTVQRSDGQCVTVYYFHQPGEELRCIAATIWDPKWLRP